ncbi:hypothetical protein ABE187_04050 [Bacillus cabrialesii]|uniref:Uncharacterized protein n=1 Tax=Bacillus cabrialesii subsp. tritici TaxID=2944916 RepID=A0ABT9DRS9_9BACI|nr:hypothetical protein [Bacillus cabrialesii]MDO8227407.1 hypothetical protein [Bacillus cabrialesii subsp. tritici]
MSRLNILKKLDFGESVAEEDNRLASYFVETDTWNRLINGEIDIIYGAKGSGKSALYKHLIHNKDYLEERNITLLAAENISGTAVFKTVLSSDELSENSYKQIWFLYIISIIGKYINEYGEETVQSKEFISRLQMEGLLDGKNLRRMLSNVKDYVVNFFRRVESLEGGLQLDSTTLIPGFTGKVSLSEPSLEQKKLGFISVYDLLDMAEEALESLDIETWIIFDRLDVSFSENPSIEKVAIRTLFQVYNDFKTYDKINLKIFIRDDIWKRITVGGFREASHITKVVTIYWNELNLRHLIINRILENEILVNQWSLSKRSILSDTEEQERLYYKVFPEQVDSGQRKPNTFNWMLSRVKDGLGIIAPRELIQLINEAKKIQIKELEIGSSSDDVSEELIGRKSIKEGLEEVSKKRLEQTIYAEYYHLKEYIELLEGQKAEQTMESLSTIFKCGDGDIKKIVDDLVNIGIFEKRFNTYWTPFIYRPALKLVQGREE